MSKKKGKNSNYKNNPTLNVTADEKRKNTIIMIVCISILAVFVIGIIVAICLAPKSSETPSDETPIIQMGDPEKTEVMGTGACAHLENRDITGRDIKYVEATFENFGKMVILLDGTTAPKTVANFVNLVKEGFYDGLTIFRAQQNFVIQGGKNDSISLTPITGEFDENGHENDISHIKGVISMARTNDPNSATSQFFITLHDSATYSLDGKYAAFGYVVEGLSVADDIAKAMSKVPSDSMGFVTDDYSVTIKSIKLLEDYTPNK